MNLKLACNLGFGGFPKYENHRKYATEQGPNGTLEWMVLYKEWEIYSQIMIST